MNETQEQGGEPKLVSYENGVWSFQSDVVPVIVDYLAAMIEESKAENYVEIEVMHQDLGKLSLTLQRKRGKTAHQLRTEAEAKWKSQEVMLDTAREAISASLEGVAEFDQHVGYWWDGAVKAIEELRGNLDSYRYGSVI